MIEWAEARADRLLRKQVNVNEDKFFGESIWILDGNLCCLAKKGRARFECGLNPNKELTHFNSKNYEK